MVVVRSIQTLRFYQHFGLRVCVALCMLAAAGACEKHEPAVDLSETQHRVDVNDNDVEHSAAPGGDQVEEERESQRLLEEVERLEAQAATLKQRVLELTEANRRAVAQFQGMELGEMAAAIGSETPVRDGVIGGSSGKGTGGTIYLWDKPGGYATGSQVMGQAKQGDRVLIAEETAVAGKRWSRIYVMSGTAFEYGWVPSRMVRVTPDTDINDTGIK